ncbi:hypothetical protein [Methylobacterium sp. SI9]|uniref:hypothetical protein n=1 Tax=Methylobacterium guangdongense TaxID=3138811 RepID=UPI00313CF67D
MLREEQIAQDREQPACRFVPIPKPSALVHAHTGVSCISSSARVVACVGVRAKPRRADIADRRASQMAEPGITAPRAANARSNLSRAMEKPEGGLRYPYGGGSDVPAPCRSTPEEERTLPFTQEA